MLASVLHAASFDPCGRVSCCPGSFYIASITHDPTAKTSAARSATNLSDSRCFKSGPRSAARAFRRAFSGTTRARNRFRLGTRTYARGLLHRPRHNRCSTSGPSCRPRISRPRPQGLGKSGEAILLGAQKCERVNSRGPLQGPRRRDRESHGGGDDRGCDPIQGPPSRERTAPGARRGG